MLLKNDIYMENLPRLVAGIDLFMTPILTFAVYPCLDHIKEDIFSSSLPRIHFFQRLMVFMISTCCPTHNSKDEKTPSARQCKENGAHRNEFKQERSSRLLGQKVNQAFKYLPD